MYKLKIPFAAQKGFVVGVAGFEPATSWSQTRRDDRATLHPVAESKGFEPLVQFPVRMFSKHVLSASQATLRCFQADANVNFYSY